ncbi:hypothetical protein MKX03_020189 [Papaver bracteatum]|nr:hypothetical protein MKX03_020189 [Papaver bracteatum]
MLNFSTSCFIKIHDALHIAAMCGHVKFAGELLRRNGELITVQDSHGFTPLSSARQCLSMVKQLLDSSDEEVCMVQDDEGRTPLHLAATKDRINIIKALIKRQPEAIHLHNGRNETILHLCVRHNSLKALKLLVEELPSVGAPTLNNEPLWMLEKVNALMVVATLVAGIAFTAAMNPPGGVFQEDSKVMASENPVIFAYYLRSVAKSTKSSRFGQYLDQHPLTQSQNMINSTNFLQELLKTLDNDTYSAYSPYVMGKSPGIVLEHDEWNKIISKYNPRFSPYLIRYAGTPILAYKNPRIYNLYMTYNAIAFLVSLSIIVLVISGFINTKKTTNHQVRVLIGMMVVSITAWLLSFISVFISMSPPFYINHPLLSRAFLISIVTLVICTHGYNLLMKARHWITILCALHSHFMSLMTKAVILKFMPVFYLILLAALSLPFLYSYTNRA